MLYVTHNMSLSKHKTMFELFVSRIDFLTVCCYQMYLLSIAKSLFQTDTVLPAPKIVLHCS